MPGKEKKGRKTARRDEKGRFVSPINGQPVPDSPASKAQRFQAGGERAKEAGKLSGIARKEKGDLRRLCQLWMEEDVGTDQNGERITGGQMMVRVAVKEIAKGNPRFWELIRDTAGFKPVDKVMVAEVDPGVIAQVEEMVKEAGDEQMPVQGVL
jgi:hypothetical protein